MVIAVRIIVQNTISPNLFPKILLNFQQDIIPFNESKEHFNVLLERFKMKSKKDFSYKVNVAADVN